MQKIQLKAWFIPCTRLWLSRGIPGADPSQRIHWDVLSPVSTQPTYEILGCLYSWDVGDQLPDSMVLTSPHFEAWHVSVALWGRPELHSAETLFCHYIYLGVSGEETGQRQVISTPALFLEQSVLWGWLWDKPVSVESESRVAFY